MANRDVFVVLIKDPCGAVYVDSIHHQAVGRGTTYEKVGALNRSRELQHQGHRVEVKRIPTGVKLSESYTVTRW